MKSQTTAENQPNRAPLLVLYLIMFLVVSGFGIITPFFPFFTKEMGASAFELGLMITLFSLAQVIAAPIWGRLSDWVGRKPILIAGLVGYALSYYLMLWSPNLQVLMIARILGGFLSASAFPSAQAYLVDLTSPEERGFGMGYMAAASNMGFLLGPALGSLLAVFGIRAAFAIGGALILVTAVLAGILLPTIRVMHRQSKEPIQGDYHQFWKAMLGRDSVLLWVTMLISFGSSTMYGILGYYMIEKFNALAIHTAIVYTLMGGVSALLQAFIIGRAMKWLGEDILVIISLLLGVVGFTGLVFSANLTILYVWVTIIGASMALSRPTILVALSRRTRLGQGLTMGLQGSFDSFGRVIGPLWAGWVFSLAISAPFWSSALIFSLATGLHAAFFFSAARTPSI